MRKLSVLITVEPHADERHLVEQISDVRFLRPSQVIVVMEKQRGSLIKAVKHSGAAVHLVNRSLDVGAGRATGAELAMGDVLLFLDSSRRVSPRLLLKLAEPALYGDADAVCLHRASVLHADTNRPSLEASLAASWNRFFGRDDLLAADLYSAPFVLSRRILRTVGIEKLNNPVMFYTSLLKSHAKIAHPSGLTEEETGRRAFAPAWHGSLPTELSAYERQLVDHYLEAMRLDLPANRGRFPDGGRNRKILKQWKENRRLFSVKKPAVPLPPSNLYDGKKLSVVIPARNEEATIASVIREVKRIEPAEIIVVDNGSQDRTADRALRSGGTVVSVAEALGTDTGRSVGAVYTTGDIVLFLDAEPVVAAEDLYPFALAVQRGIDIALNDLNDGRKERWDARTVAPAMFALNGILGEKRLGNASMSMVPFAISRRALKRIGWETLVCPPRALAAGVLSGMRAEAVHRVDVETTNRPRSEHATGEANRTIIGDHLEAFHEVLKRRGI